MNNLITTDVKMTSLDIAEVTGKQHQHILRDIRKEIEDLGEEVGQSIFGRTSYIDKSNRPKPCYEFSKDGAMQLALKYDAKTRYNVIQYVEKLENKPVSQLDVLQGAVNQLVEQETRLIAIEQKQDDIKEIFTLNSYDWRDKIKKIINKIGHENGGIYESLWKKTYSELEIRGRCNLKVRLNNIVDRALKHGASKREVRLLNNLDVIDRDQKLKEIYLTIVKELAIKYGLSSDDL